jgi:hypothetical protein
LKIPFGVANAAFHRHGEFRINPIDIRLHFDSSGLACRGSVAAEQVAASRHRLMLGMENDSCRMSAVGYRSGFPAAANAPFRRQCSACVSNGEIA